MRPHVWHGRCPGDTPIPAKPSQACLVWRSRLRCWCALAILVVKLQTFLFQMVVTSCISVQYLWRYGFAKSPDNLYTPCILKPTLPSPRLWATSSNCGIIPSFGNRLQSYPKCPDCLWNPPSLLFKLYQLIPAFLSPGVNRLRYEDDRSPPASHKVDNEWRHTSTNILSYVLSVCIGTISPSAMLCNRTKMCDYTNKPSSLNPVLSLHFL